LIQLIPWYFYLTWRAKGIVWTGRIKKYHSGWYFWLTPIHNFWLCVLVFCGILRLSIKTPRLAE
jgi:hypothetical protein